MKSPHLLDISRMKFLQERHESAMAAAQKASGKINELVEKRNYIDKEVFDLEHRWPSHAQQGAQWERKVDDLKQQRIRIEAEIRDRQADRENLQERSKAASNLYRRCTEFMEGR